MRTKTQNRYKEVRLPENRNTGTYKHPMTNTFRYEYALYSVVSDLFGEVTCRSMCIDRLRLYFIEQNQHSAETAGDAAGNEEEKKPKKSQASMLQEIETLVNRDVIGKINFPSMHECHAESCAVPDENGAHTFIFTDGVYGFSLKLDMLGKGSPKGIIVTDLFPGRG